MKNLLTILLFIVQSSFATNYYVKNGGSDAAAGTSDATAWATLAKINSRTFSAGDSILFKSGNTFTGWLIVPSNNIKFSTYGGTAKAILSGLTTLTGFTNSGNIYTCTNTLIKDSLNLVLMDGYHIVKGRTPNGNASFENFWYPSSQTANTLTGPDLSGRNYVGGDLIRMIQTYIFDRNRITAHSGSTITVTGMTTVGPSEDVTTPQAAGSNYCYFIQNHISTLDTYGEWYRNIGTQQLSIYLDGSGTAGHTFEAPFVDTIVNMGNKSGISITNLIFKGANQFAIWGLLGSNDSVRNCEVYNCGNGIIFNNIQNLQVNYNIVKNSLQNAITAQCRQRSGIEVRGNIVDSTGLLVGQGVMMASRRLRGIVFETDTTRNTAYSFMSENRITNTGHSGSWVSGSQMYVDSNYIYNFCGKLMDGGGIYTWQFAGAPTSTNIRAYNRFINNNIIRKADGFTNYKPGTTNKPDVAGLYFDDGCQNITAHDNVITDIRGNGFQVNGNGNLTAYNNLMHNDSVALFVSQKATAVLTNVRITKNLVYQKSNNGNYLHTYFYDRNTSITTAATKAQLTMDSSKFYYKPFGFRVDASTKLSGASITSGLYPLSNFQSLTGQEAHSSVYTDSTYLMINDSLTAQNKPLPGRWIDAKTGTSYINVIPMQGMQGKLLFYQGTASSMSVTGTNVLCYGESNGTASASVVAPAPITYVWTPGGATTSTISGLAPGTYTVTATDGVGNKLTGKTTITQPAAALAINVTYGVIYSGGSTTTDVLVTATGGTAPYSGTGIFTRNVGTFIFIVTDANGCTARDTITIPLTPAPSFTITLDSVDVNCYGGTGTANSNISGGTAPYTRLWSTGATTSSITAPAGIYTLTVTDALSVVSSKAITINQPTLLIATNIPGTVTVAGDSTTVLISASGGTPSYTGTGTFYQVAGIKSYTVTDAHGCTAQTIATVPYVPTVPEVPVEQKPNKPQKIRIKPVIQN